VRNLNEDNVTQAVIARHLNASDVRFREVMTGLIQHLHAFAREVHLTEAEWLEGIKFLTAVGRVTDDKRQEFILLSDTLGLSMLVTAQNQKKPPGCTESTVFGPFYLAGAPHYDHGDDVSNGAPGLPCLVRGRIKDLEGRGVAGAEIEVWQADAEGYYDVQYAEHAAHRARGVFRSGPDGGFHFRSIVAEAYPIPHDGPVGRMLEKLGRHPWRPAHLHFMITAPGYQTLITHVFRNGDQYLDSDAVFGVRQSLIAEWAEQPDGSYLLDFDFVLNRTDERKLQGIKA
jgi:hydroxyquinol 1,2-dioxygenase